MSMADPVYRSCRVVTTLLLAVVWAAPALGQSVVTLNIPDGGRLPQVVLDDGGTLHLIYVVGDTQHGDLMYVTRPPGASGWSAPAQVNSAEGTVTGFGPIDGGRLALGKNGRLHVAWMRISPTAFFYTRTNEDGQGFEEQFAVASGDGVETGPSVAADHAGNVYLFWHSGGGEDAGRAVYMAASRDEGFIFELARPINAEVEGACACCGLAALTDDTGAIYLSYRGARDNVGRGQRLLTSRDAGGTFTDTLIQPWNVGACPVATTSLGPGPSGMTVAWETQGQIYFAGIDQLEDRVSPPGTADKRRKNPAVAVNRRGETLLAWGDGSGFRSGGTLHWQLFDATGRPAEHGDGTKTVPDSSVPIALVQSDDTFLLIY